jgi:PAS domain S-box-containing protein
MDAARPEGAATPRDSPNREKRRTIAYLRGLLLVAAGGVLLAHGLSAAGPGALLLLVVFTLSNVSILAAPLRLVSSFRFELLVGALDVVFIALAIHAAGAAGGVLPVSCLLTVLVVALANRRPYAVAGLAVAAALHAWLVLVVAPATDPLRSLAPQILLLGSIALYYGYLAEGIHRLRAREEADKSEARELRILLEILETITSSLDLAKVTGTIVEKVTTIIPAVRCSMLFVDESRRRCFVMASHDDPRVSMRELDLDKYPEIRRAIETRGPVLIQDVAADPLMAEVRTALEALDFQSIMVIPMVFRDDVLGTLCMKTARADQPFTRREIGFCTAVARASANALKNALLHQEVHEESAHHRRLADKLTRIFDHSPDLVLTTDEQGRVTECNRGTARLLGYGREEILGRPAASLLADPGADELLARVRTTGALLNHACRLRRRTGTPVDVELNLSVLRDEQERPAGTVWLGRDVTELKTTQLQLLQAKKLSTIGEVISGVAHELNNPLSAVLGFSQLLLGRPASAPVRRELEKIHESALRCQRIVGNLLSFARVHRPERRYLGINGIIEKTLDIKRYQLHVNNIAVVTDLDPQLPRTMIDFHQMQQVLLNLVNNAQHAMVADDRSGGLLSIRTSEVSGWVRIEISDDGGGMDEQTLERIFDPFFTTKEPGEGTGLGLSVSYGIVKEHGGRIWARSCKDEGTTFTIELPVRTAPEEGDPVRPGTETAVPGPPAAPGRRILVVDDEPLILDLMLEVLVERGYQVDTAGNGREAARKIDGEPYDLVISDVRMPQMNGMDLYRRVLSSRPELEGRVVFVTGDLIDREIVQFLADVQARTLPKPLEIDKIVGVVDDLLRPGGGRPLA